MRHILPDAQHAFVSSTDDGADGLARSLAPSRRTPGCVRSSGRRTARRALRRYAFADMATRYRELYLAAARRSR
ncbi:MAG: hypothetical protein R3F34_07210 [Planctomycetota bacterium]